MALVKDSDTLAAKIANQYKLDYVKIFPALAGYRNQSFKIELANKKLLNLMIFKAEPTILQKIEIADHVSEVLAKSGLPTRIRVNKKLLKLSASAWPHSAYAGLYNYLPGHTISWEAYTKNHIKLLGMAMGRMHAVFHTAATTAPSNSAAASIYKTLFELLVRMQQYLERSDVQQALNHKLHIKYSVDFRQLEESLKLGQQLPIQHYLHMDFVRSNVLFSEAESPLRINNLSISGIIDFEKTAFGTPLFDLARSLAFLLVDCKYKRPEKIRKYFLYSGYQKRGNGQTPRLKLKFKNGSTLLLDEYVKFFLLHDFYKFLRHSPYESLDQNEHFKRTCSILQTFGMLEYN